MIYQFGDCALDTARETLRRTGEVINMAPQALKVLRYLIDHRARVVSRDELLEQCWPESYVSDASLTSYLRRVRQAIGQQRPGPALIETVHRRGYRFVAEVTESLAQQLDPEDHYDLLQTFSSTCLDLVALYEGYLAQQLNDGVVVYFGYPQAHEDDAQRAVRSGLALVEAMRHGALGALSVRVGIATGMMIVSSGGVPDTPPSLGTASGLAARLGALTPPATVVISEATARLVADYFVCKVLNEAANVGTPELGLAYEVRGESALQTRLEVESAYGLTPFVGREAEIALLRERWTYVQEGLGQVVVVQGEAGVGKSRLVQALKEQVVGELPLAIECRCLPYHQHTALYPFIDLGQRWFQGQSLMSSAMQLESLEALLAQYDGALEETVPLLASLLSIPLPEGRYAPLTLSVQRQRERTLETLLSLLLVQASKSPLLFVVEDVHWADPSTLECLRFLTDQVATASMLVVLTCRPEFEAPWSQCTEMTPVVLNRLTRTQTERMITQVAAVKHLPKEVLTQLVEKTDGVPLFVEELTRMVLESGQLVERNGQYELRGELSQLTIPATLHDSLMARLDRLGKAKELAQWAAVLGREFSYEVLGAVTSYDGVLLREGLARLVEAGLVFQRGLLPRAHYRFKHALIQDSAYGSLLKRHRQAMHQQIATVLGSHFPQTVETQPELVAQHYTAADNHEQAIPYWYRAGQIALQAPANQEAIEHLKKGLELLARCPEAPERARQELDFQTTIGPALMVTQGFGHPEVEHAYTRARELCEQVGQTSELFPVLWGLLRCYRVRGELHSARQLGDDLLRLAQSDNNAILLLASHAALGSILYFLGEFAAARTYLEQGLTHQDAQRDRSYNVLHGEDPGVQCLHFLSWTLWYLGYPDQALQRNHEALTLAQTLAHPASQVATLYGADRLRRLRRELRETYKLAEATIAFSTEQGIAYQLALGTFMRGWVLVHQGQKEEGLAQMSESLAAIRQTGGEVSRPSHLALLAQAYGKAEQAEKGLALITEAQALMDKNGQRFYDAEVYVLWGDLLLHQAVPDVSGAETCFKQALAVACQQQAKSWALRAAMRLARLWQQRDKCQEARDLLAPIYGWFTEGFETADLQDIKTLLDELVSP
ncbi:AAA family ATPase [Candidatus Entotheonella palauensis]|uniref:AAA family ATPase n=1 Tax=Candidatus Entotheonella palauensis TaxID=93172 RepID=UPI000B7EC38B|nr:AAA family ATPase [Candidatus Entotheonella palauensis]